MTDRKKQSYGLKTIISRISAIAAIYTVFAAINLSAGSSVSGKVQDSSSNNLPDINVKVVGTQNKTVTDVNGDFKLDIGNSKRVNLYFSAKGYYSKTSSGVKPDAKVAVKLKPIANDDGFIKYIEPISMSHSVTWLRAKDRNRLDSKVDEKTFEEMVKKYGEADKEQVVFRIRFPENGKKVKAIFLISEHGIGQYLLESKKTWKFADKNDLALIGVIGNPIQRGIYPNSYLDGIIADIGKKYKHPELATVPVITFGHSNGTGFSAFYAASNPDRTIGWISYHSGGRWHLEFPGVEKSPGLVMHGMKDIFFKGQEKSIDMLRTKRDAAVCMTMEPFVAHWPADRDATYDFLFEFCEACLRKPMNKNGVDLKSGWLGSRYDKAKGGVQKPEIAPYAEFKGDRNNANWMPDEKFAKVWQTYRSKAK